MSVLAPGRPVAVVTGASSGTGASVARRLHEQDWDVTGTSRLADGGRVVLTGSRSGVGVAGTSQHTATKAVQEALGRSWAADLVGFLLGPGGRSITGQHLVVCGGASL